MSADVKLEGWGQIAKAAERSVDTVQRWSHRKVDPLPVFFVAGKPTSTRVMVTMWLKRNTLPAMYYRAMLAAGLINVDGELREALE